jgi:hypothetical protein
MITSAFPIPGVAKHRRSLLQGESLVASAALLRQLGPPPSTWQLFGDAA